MSPEQVIAVAVPIVLAVVWLIRLEGRLNTHERGCTERQMTLNERHTGINIALNHIDTKLDRMVEVTITAATAAATAASAAAAAAARSAHRAGTEV